MGLCEHWRTRPRIALPPPATLEDVFSTCYQASLLHEEERPVTFRVILCDPDQFPGDDDGPPAGVHRLRFADARPFTEAQSIGSDR